MKQAHILANRNKIKIKIEKNTIENRVLGNNQQKQKHEMIQSNHKCQTMQKKRHIGSLVTKFLFYKTKAQNVLPSFDKCFQRLRTR